MLACLAAAFLLNIPSDQQQVTDPSQELAEIQKRLAKAWMAADRLVIERIIEPNWTITGTDGRLSTRVDVLREVFETKVHRITANEIDDVRVRLLGDAAVVTGHTHGPGKHNEVAYDISSRFTDVFVRREGP